MGIMLNSRFPIFMLIVLLALSSHLHGEENVGKSYRSNISASYNHEYGKKPITKNELLRRIEKFRKKNSYNKKTETIKGNAYIGYNISVKKRNVTLLLIPSMYHVARGKRNYAGESLNQFELQNGKIKNFEVKYSTGTIPKNKTAISIMRNLLLPDIYGETIFGEFLLSPCNLYNMPLYNYKISRLTFDRVEMVFRPKVKNTQLISGKAIINESTGKILSASFKGEFDMLKFNVNINMDNPNNQLFRIPFSCDMTSELNFMGNKVHASHYIYFNSISDTLLNNTMGKDDKEIMNRLRPVPLKKEIKDIYEDFSVNDKQLAQDSLLFSEESDENTDSIYHNASCTILYKDTCLTRKASTNNGTFKKIVSSLGDYFLEKISGNFGTNAQGNYKISPLMNPLSLSYSNSKGLTYKLRLYGGYRFSEKSDINVTVKAGYSFKQKQFYTSIPVKMNINKTFSVETEFGIGNRITNSEILDKIKDEKYDSIKWDKMNLDYFKDLYWKAKLRTKINNKLTFTSGFVYHKRTATDKYGFILSEKPYKYYSFAPTLQLQYQPWLSKGPIFSVDYERGIKGVIHSSMDYERVETDISWKRYLHSMRVLSMKFGYGIYTSRSKNTYFLDFTNFKYENIPGGWDDDWTGEFQLLNSNWYNASRFYNRTNVTYESPLLFLSWLPIIGKYIETERIYGNWLFTDNLHPYVEIGYGFTNKLFSTGMFFSMSNKKFGALGIRFGLELFKDW